MADTGHAPSRKTTPVVEAIAEQMWNLLADIEADETRGICRNGPVVREGRDWVPQRWDAADGAWRREMIEMAEAAMAVVEDDLLAPLNLKIEVLREDKQAMRAQWEDDVAALREANRQLCDQARESKTARAEVIAEVIASLRREGADEVDFSFAERIQREFG